MHIPIRRKTRLKLSHNDNNRRSTHRILWWSCILQFISCKIKHQNCAVRWWAREWSGAVLTQKNQTPNPLNYCWMRDDLMYYACVLERLFILSCSGTTYYTFYNRPLNYYVFQTTHTLHIYTLGSKNNESQILDSTARE